jgi:hypothetical protein
MTEAFELRFEDDELPNRCRVAAIISSNGHLQIAVMEMKENHGRSVTNSWPVLADRILGAAFPAVDATEVEWFEVYPYRFAGGKENVSRVLLSKKGWRRSHRFDYEQDALIRERIWAALEIEA